MTEVTLALAPLDQSDIGLIRNWRNDYRIWRWTRQNDLISDAAQVRWFNKQSEDPTIRMWKLVAGTVQDGKETRAPIGVCGLTSIDWPNSRAEFSLYLAPDLHGKGFGYRALCILLEHGFTNLGLGLIWGETFDGNHAYRLFEKVGMVKEGTRRRFYWKDGKWTDAHLYSITREEWLGRSVSAVDRLGADHSGGVQHDSGGSGGVSASSGQGDDCPRASGGSSPNVTDEDPKPDLAREKAGAKKARSSRRRDDVAPRAG